MTQTVPLQPLEVPRQLVHRCLDHLRREEAELQRLVDQLRQVRMTCLAGRLDELNALLFVHPGSLEQQRNQLRLELAAILGAPPERVTLTYLIHSLPPYLRDQIEPLAGRLRALLKEAEHLSHQNAALLGYSLSFLRRLFHTLEGGFGVDRYNLQGRREDGTARSLLQPQRG